jgi:catechol 2,3-dioxygenase-like lactoylglutathione lyase family enzyme
VSAQNEGMEIQLSMLGVIVRDMPTALRFYRLLGLEIPSDEDAKRFVIHRMGTGVSIFFDTVFAAHYDGDYRAPARGGYGSMFEFYLGDDASVNAKYAELTAAGYHGRLAPQQTSGPYAGMVDDPDGNVILLTSDDQKLPTK